MLTIKDFALGYPRASKHEEGRELTPASGLLTGGHHDQPFWFGVDHCDLPNDPHVGWPGMSGSAVLLQVSADEEKTIWIYGVVKEVPANFNSQLRIARLEEAWKRPDFRSWLVKAGVPDLDAEDPESIAREPDALSEEEEERFSRVFVRPNIYRKATETFFKERLIILQGPGSVGKTTTGINLLAEVRRVSLSATQPILRPSAILPRPEDLEKLENALILLDAPFGARDAYEPADSNITAHFDSVVKMARRNWVVVTTRPGPLKEAERIMERADLDKYVVSVTYDSYNEVKLRHIFFKHLLYHRKHRDLTSETVTYIRDKVSWIVSNLRFPHNIARFVQDELPTIISNEDIKVGLARSKDTKEAAKVYFSERNSEEILFMLSVAFFGHYLQENTFRFILTKFFSMREIGIPVLRVFDLRRSLRYIRQQGSVAFDHQDYLDGVLKAVRNDQTIDPYIKLFCPLLQELSKHSDKSILKCLGLPLRELARVDPQSASPITLDLLRHEDPHVVRAAYIPLRVLVKNDFETVRPFLEKAVSVDQVKNQVKNPNYPNILFRKAMRKYLLVPFIERCDVDAVVEFVEAFHKDLKVEVFIVLGLYDAYGCNPESATSFFREWWLHNPKRSLVSLQDFVMTKGGTAIKAKFVAKLLGAINPSSAVNAIIDWSRTESRNEVFRANLGVVLGEFLKHLAATGLGASIEEIVKEWKNTGNDIQRRAAQRFYRLELS